MLALYTPKSGAWAMLQQVLQILFIDSSHPSLDSVHTSARAYILLTEVKASPLSHGHSSQVVYYKQECRCFILIFWLNLFKPYDSGFSFVDGDNLLVSNLSNGVNLYSLHTMQQLQHYKAAMTINVPLQVELARQNLNHQFAHMCVLMCTLALCSVSCQGCKGKCCKVP